MPSDCTVINVSALHRVTVVRLWKAHQKKKTGTNYDFLQNDRVTGEDGGETDGYTVLMEHMSSG